MTDLKIPTAAETREAARLARRQWIAESMRKEFAKVKSRFVDALAVAIRTEYRLKFSLYEPVNLQDIAHWPSLRKIGGFQERLLADLLKKELDELGYRVEVCVDSSVYLIVTWNPPAPSLDFEEEQQAARPSDGIGVL